MIWLLGVLAYGRIPAALYFGISSSGISPNIKDGVKSFGILTWNSFKRTHEKHKPTYSEYRRSITFLER